MNATVYFSYVISQKSFNIVTFKNRIVYTFSECIIIR